MDIDSAFSTAYTNLKSAQVSAGRLMNGVKCEGPRCRADLERVIKHLKQLKKDVLDYQKSIPVKKRGSVADEAKAEATEAQPTEVKPTEAQPVEAKPVEAETKSIVEATPVVPATASNLTRKPVPTRRTRGRRVK